jgi:hypothetical protein
VLKSEDKNESEGKLTGDMSKMSSGDSGRLTGENVGERMGLDRVGIFMGVEALYGIA